MMPMSGILRSRLQSPLFPACALKLFGSNTEQQHLLHCACMFIDLDIVHMQLYFPFQSATSAMNESQKKSYPIIIILLIAIIAGLAGIVIYQQIEIAAIQPITVQSIQNRKERGD